MITDTLFIPRRNLDEANLVAGRLGLAVDVLSFNPHSINVLFTVEGEAETVGKFKNVLTEMQSYAAWFKCENVEKVTAVLEQWGMKVRDQKPAFLKRKTMLFVQGNEKQLANVPVIISEIDGK